MKAWGGGYRCSVSTTMTRELRGNRKVHVGSDKEDAGDFKLHLRYIQGQNPSVNVESSSKTGRVLQHPVSSSC